jgi:hypothetical protein
LVLGGAVWWPYRKQLPPMGKGPWGAKEAQATPNAVEKEPETVDEKRLDAMQRLGAALGRYTDANGGMYPATLRTLTADGYLPADAAESLWGPKGFLLQYSGAGAKRSDGRTRVVLVFPAPAGTNVKTLIMYADGKTEGSGSVVAPGVMGGGSKKGKQ